MGAVVAGGTDGVGSQDDGCALCSSFPPRDQLAATESRPARWTAGPLRNPRSAWPRPRSRWAPLPLRARAAVRSTRRSAVPLASSLDVSLGACAGPVPPRQGLSRPAPTPVSASRSRQRENESARPGSPPLYRPLCR